MEISRLIVFTTALLAVWISQGHNAKATVILQDHRVTFDRCDGNLDWPLPDVHDPGLLIIHGIHCYQIIDEGSANRTDNMTLMHMDHCKNVIQLILNKLESNPHTYKVNEWICKSFYKDRKQRLVQIAVAYWGNLFDYPLKFGGYSGGKYFHYRKRRDTNAQDTVIIERNQNDIYTRLAARNFGNLLMRNWTDASTVNNEEREYLEKWLSPSAIALSTIGTFCRTKGDLGMIRSALYTNK